MKLARTSLENLSASRSSMLSNGLPEINPDVMELSEKIISVEDRIQTLAEAKLKALDIELAELKISSKELDHNLDSLPGEEIRFIKLNRERQVLETIYNNILSRLRGAQINEAIPVENISILDPAIPSFTPVTGDKKRNYLLGFLGGLFLGIGTSVVI